MRPEVASELGKLGFDIPFGNEDAPALAKRLSKLGPLISTAELPEVIPIVVKELGHRAGLLYVPHPLKQVVEKVLEGRSARIVCDPWAGIGEMLAIASVATHAAKALALTRNQPEAALGRVLFHAAEWRIGEPLELLNSLKTELDVVASILPLGAKTKRAIVLEGLDGRKTELQDDLGHLILVAAAVRLSAQGVGLFVVPPSFFLSGRSVLRRFTKLGLAIESALAIPSGAFTPYTNVSTYLVTVKKGAGDRMFVAQLSSDSTANSQIVSNLREGKEGGALDLGRFVDPQSFRSIGAIRTAERFETAARKFGAPSVLLGDLATAIHLGRHGEDLNLVNTTMRSLFL